ncbi:MAG: hypothetical protein Q4C49_09370 [Bacillota bacterium]|nr:hypothetical protein [Bacillota bacterium]
MLNDFYDAESEPIVNFEAFYGPKRNMVEKCLVIFSKVIYDSMVQQFECTLLAEIYVCNGNIPIWEFEYNRKKVAFYCSH